MLKTVLFDNRIKRTAIAMMTKLDARDVEWLRAFTLCCFKDALGLNEHELRNWVDEAFDEPGHAMRSTLAWARVTYFNASSPHVPFVDPM
jgi:hypothetical protein